MISNQIKTPNRNFTLIAGIAIQLCLGVAYVWSVFQTGVAETLFGGDNAAAGLSYSILLAFLTLGSVLGGSLSRKVSMQMVVLTGGIILTIGFLLASFTSPDFPQLLWLTYGGLGGIGMGFLYSPTIACVQKLFPHKKGFVTGLIVAALGMGGVVFTPIIEALITAFGGQGQGELMTFRIMAFIFLAITVIGSFFFRIPPEPIKKQAGVKDENSIGQIIKNPTLYIITISMMLACMGGLMMIGFAKPIAVGRGMVETATIGVLMISIFNALGRLLWGIISDKLGRANTLIILIIGSCVLSLLVALAEGYWIFVIIAFIGFFYGGLLSNYPSLTAELLGAENVATKYGIVLLGFGAGAIIASYIAGYFLNIAGDNMDLIFPAFAIASSCSFVSLILMIYLRKLLKKSK